MHTYNTHTHTHTALHVRLLIKARIFTGNTVMILRCANKE